MEKSTKKVYVTFQHKSLIDGVKKFAVECPSREDAMSLAYNINSLLGVRYVRLNETGVFAKGTVVKSSINEIFS